MINGLHNILITSSRNRLRDRSSPKSKIGSKIVCWVGGFRPKGEKNVRVGFEKNRMFGENLKKTLYLPYRPLAKFSECSLVVFNDCNELVVNYLMFPSILGASVLIYP